ncbi:MAG: hypothetical protein ACRDA5_15395 [Clostridium sp.]
MSMKSMTKSLVCTLFILISLSTYSHAATINDSKMKKDLEENITNFEQVFSSEKSHYNLNESDIILNNLMIGEVYENTTIDINSSDTSDDLNKKLKKENKYVGTIKLKDSNKPIALAYIEKLDSKWRIVRINSYDLLDMEIESYKKSSNTEPIVIIDDANQIYALGSNETGNSVKIIETNTKLNLKSGETQNIKELQPKLKEKRLADTKITNGMVPSQTKQSNYLYLLITIFSITIILFLYKNYKKSSNSINRSN